MIRRPPRSTQSRSSAASDVYKRQEEGRSGDSIVGGRLAHHNGSKYEIGVSFKASENDGETAEEMMGVDLALALPEDIRLSGYSSYNQESEDWAEQSWD